MICQFLLLLSTVCRDVCSTMTTTLTASTTCIALHASMTDRRHRYNMPLTEASATRVAVCRTGATTASNATRVITMQVATGKLYRPMMVVAIACLVDCIKLM